jgi:ATP-dependent DNA ligase
MGVDSCYQIMKGGVLIYAYANKRTAAGGIVGKHKDSVYEPGRRSGAWIKHRVNLGQEFVIGGFTPGLHGLDAIIVGYYRGKDLVDVARTRNAFVPASRRTVFGKLHSLVTPKCPFVKPTGNSEGTVGRSADRRENEDVCLGSARDRSPD